VSAPERPLLERRLVIVTGKGGTGKSSVVAALALAAAQRGRRVCVVETGLDEQIPRLFDPAAPPVGYAGRTIHENVMALRIEPYAALAEYLGLRIGGRRVVELLLRNKAFRQLMDAAPGWRELITLGKVWHLEQVREEGGAARYDLILVDAPATGHGLTFLDVPRVAVAAVRMGPLRRHAGWVEELIRDGRRTLLLPVALAEELPARETAELVGRVRAELDVSVDRVVVNAVAPAPFPPDLPDLDERLARLPRDAALAGLPSPATLAACAAHLRQRHELNAHYLGEIARATGLPVVPLPYLPSGVAGPGDLSRLAEALLAEPQERAA
jgi:anion-transporting  ArsA/GET3 family ATPase